MSDDVNDFLMGEGGAPSAKFTKHGDTCVGRVVESKMRQQTDIKTGEPLTWDDGNPRMQAVVTVQTDTRDPAIDDDDGQRRLFVKGQMQKAVREAIRASGAKSLEPGGTLAVQYTGDGPPKVPGLNPPKLFRAQYKPPAVGVDDLLGAGNGDGGQAVQQEAPAAVATTDLLPG